MNRPQQEPQRRRFRRRSLMALVAVCAAVASVASTSAPAQAVSPTDVVNYIRQAYGLYQQLAGNQLTLEGAVSRLEADINAAQAAIVAEIDAIALADARACTATAYDTIGSLPTLSPDSKFNFAVFASNCAEHAKSYMEAASDMSAADQLGLVVNIIGPIALFAQTAAGLSNSQLKSHLITANNENIARLAPNCVANPLTGDSEPGQPLEYELICTAYNGDMGFDSGIGTVGLDFSYAIAQALRNTSSPVSSAALVLLNAMA